MRPRLDLLLIDDNPADAHLVREALVHDAMDVHLAHHEDGESALGMLASARPEARPNVVLLDWNLPGAAGAAVLARLKADPVLRLIPVIVFSSSRSPRDIERAYALGASCYLVKPLGLREFTDLIRLVQTFWSRAVTRTVR